MDDRSFPERTPGPDAGEVRDINDILARAAGRARLALAWERLWPVFAAALTVIGLFLAVSWLGLWPMLPPLGRLAGVVLFIVALGVALAPLVRFRMPDAEEARRRLDRMSGRPHRPATAVTDDLAVTASDPVSLALWRAHVARALAAARALRAGWPRPLLALRDPVAIRALVAVLLVAAFFTGGDRLGGVMAAFDWRGAVTPANMRVDAWVSPPPYTGRPPVVLPGLRPGETAQKASITTVPAGSVLVVRASGNIHPEIVASGGLRKAEEGADGPAASREGEHRFIVLEAGSATLKGLPGGDLAWAFAAIPDQPPAIALTGDPEPQLRGSMKLGYSLADDYGVSAARATFALRGPRAAGGNAHPLYEAPDFALSLPQGRTRSGTAETLKDLTQHPWAGAPVTMTLVAADEGGNEGRSDPHDFMLPQRPFVNPLARALVEQRRDLALDANAREHVQLALDALGLAPERFGIESNIYLGLRAVFWQLGRAKSDDDLREVVDRLWAMAITIEDGNISDAEQALRAAQDALRQALENGASDEEIKRLMDELRAALDKFMQAMAEELRRNPDQALRPLDRNAQELRPQDLNAMLDKMEQLARSGARDAARQMLSQLQQMLENLQMARPGGQQQQGENEDEQALNQLGEMIRRQRELRDRTYQQGQNQQNSRRGRPQQGQNGDQPTMDELRQNQQALRDQLNRLMEQLRQRGQQPGQQGGEQGEQGMGQQLGSAGEAMGEAEGALGEGDAGNAVDAQGRALEALRQGAQSLAQAMQQQPGQGEGEGPGQPGRMGQPRADRDTDPLGRPLRGRDYGDDTSVKVPGEIDVQRARRILEELRKRLGQTERPQLELDYIERLLRGF